jgi:hypothetical protein
MPRVLTSPRSSTPGKSSPRIGRRRGNDGTGFFGARTSETGGGGTENELRKDFTPTERVAIAKAIEEEISRGHGGDRKSGGNQVVNRPLEKKSREVAAEKAGFGSEVTYRRAKKALDIFPAAVAN